MFYAAYISCRVTVMLRAAFFLIVFWSCVLRRAHGATGGNEKMDVFRLPNNTEPVAYKLTIRPIIDAENNIFTFTGNVTISIRVKSSTKVLTLNADGLKIDSVSVADAETKDIVDAIEYNYTMKNEQLNVYLDKPGLIADRVYDVKISYEGQLRDDMTGFYKSSYADEKSNSTK